MWTIQLLGGLAAHSQLRQLTRFRTQKAASLLAFLAVQTAPQPRETLIEMLWPDTQPEVGRHNLSNALSFLRHSLEPPGVPPGTVILADRFTVGLNPCAVTTDVVSFETAARQAGQAGLSPPERLARLEQAARLYQGPLLPGFYEEWIAPRSQRLETLFVQVVVELVPLLLHVGKCEAAVTYARRAASADPLSEEVTWHMMQALVATGQPEQALRAYRAFRQRLQDELNLQPSAALQCLARQLEQSGLLLMSGALPEDDPPTAIAFVVAPGNLNLTVPPEPALNRTVYPMSPGRLMGGEFLLRTTTRFFGREEEVARLSKLLSSPRTRLVTLTGPGGTGKTRLALEVAAQMVERTTDLPLPDAPTLAVFVPLAHITEPERLFDVILRALGNLPASDQDPLDQLAHALEAHPNTLLVLDNFEQLAEEGALRVHDMLAKATTVKLLVTSRLKLPIEEEREFHLSPLPTFTGVQGPDELLSVASIALFVDRAQATLPEFQLTERNAAVVSQLCDYLEGLPLSLELAAARVAVLPPARMLEQMQANRLDFLTTRRRDVSSRQRTLRATLDWSYQLLPEVGRQFLGQASVFRGGWTLAAAAAVCGLTEAETLELLTLLRDSSLIQVTDTEEGMRFTLLETVREYAAEHLEGSREREAVCRRHREFFLELAEEAEPHLTSSDKVVWLERLETEHENLRAALAWSLEEGKRCEEADVSLSPLPFSHATLRFCGALHWFWVTRGHLAEGSACCKTALEARGAETRTVPRAKVLITASMLAINLGEYITTRAYIEEALTIQQEIGDRQGIAASLNSLGNLASYQADYVASRAYLEESLTIRREIGDRQGIAASLNNLGGVPLRQGDYVAARAYLEESLTIRREIGDRHGIAAPLTNLGSVAYVQGDYVAARAYLEESLAIQREIGDRHGIAASLINLGSVTSDQGDYIAARAYLEECLAIQREIGDRRGIAASLNNLGNLATAQGDFTAAKAYLEESLTIRVEIGDRHGNAESLNNLGNLATSQRDYIAARACFEESLAIQHEIGDRRGIGRSFHNLGEVSLNQGDYVAARDYLEECLAIQQEIGSPRDIAYLLEVFAALITMQTTGVTVTAETEENSGKAGTGARRAARLWGAAQTLREQIGAQLSPTELRDLELKLGPLREWLGEAAWAAAGTEGRAMTLAQAIACAVAQEEAPSRD